MTEVKNEKNVDLIKDDLHSKLWSITSDLRGSMSDQDYKNYILGMMFYKKVSSLIEGKYDEALREDVEYFIEEGLLKDNEGKESFHSYIEMWDLIDEKSWELAYKEVVLKEEITEEDLEDMDENIVDMALSLEYLKREAIESVGVFIPPHYFFTRFDYLINVEKEGFDIELMEKGLNSMIESSKEGPSEKLFDGIFEDFDLQSTKIGKRVSERNEVVEILVTKLADIDFNIGSMDLMGDAYEYLIGKFATNSGAKSGSFYTPYQVGELMGRIIGLEKSEADIAGDFTGGSGSLLLSLSNHVKIKKFAYQELITNTFNIARMNMVMHGKNYDHFRFGEHEFSMYNGDALKEPMFIDDKLDVIVANPPYSQKWCSDPKFLNDERYQGPGRLAPKNYADYAFLLTMYHSLADDGIMAIVLPHGVLFRGGAEGKIREWLIKENAIDTVIGLPEDIFFGTSIPTAILILKKNKDTKDIFFIDAKDEFKKTKAKNTMTDKNIDKIAKAYEDKKPVERFADIATIEDIEENDYNLNIPRYVDTFEPEEDIDVEEVQKEIRELRREIYEIDLELDEYFKELGLSGILEGDRDE